MTLSTKASTAIANTDALVTLTIGGQALGSIVLTTALTAGDAAKELTIGGLNFVSAATSVTLGGLDFDVTYANGKITLTGTGKGGAGADPTAADVKTFHTQSLAVGSTFSANATDNNNGYDFAVHAKEAVTAASSDKLAQGKFTLTDGDIKNGGSITIGDATYTFVVGADNKKTTYGATELNLTDFEEGASGLGAAAARLLSQAAVGNTKFHVQTVNNSGEVRLTEIKDAVDYKTDWDLQGTATAADAPWTNKDTGASPVKLSKGGKALTLQIGDTAANYNQLTVDIQDMHCSSLGIASINVGNQTDAKDAIDKIKTAINTVSDVRGGLGATQNRLEHTINNLSVMTENIQDAESTIRDTDVAEEMMAYTKNNILIQSAQAMLAQANQVPQGVLQLLQ